MSDDNDSDDVGYGKPPKATRFKKGVSGNPQGRPKGSPNVLTAVQRALVEKVVINENGKRKTISKLDAFAKQLANKAAQGDQRAMGQLLALAQLLDEKSAGASTLPMEEADHEVFDLIVQRIRNTKPDGEEGGK